MWLNDKWVLILYYNSVAWLNEYNPNWVRIDICYHVIKYQLYLITKDQKV